MEWGDNLSDTFHDFSGNVQCDWCYCEYVVVVIGSSDTDEGEFHNSSLYISIFRLEFDRWW